MSPSDHTDTHTTLEDELNQLKTIGRLRQLQSTQLQPDGTLLRGSKHLIDAASNDYLGLAAQPSLNLGNLATSVETSLEAMHTLVVQAGYAADWPTVQEALSLHGSGGSRHITGNHPMYELLERHIARLKGKETALVFGSGYQANVGVLSALLGPQDAVFSDALNHASIIDGIRLGRAQKHIYHHRDMQHLDELLTRHTHHQNDQLKHTYKHTYRHRLIVSDALFSMDGTLAPLPELVELARKHQAWLMLDEAHTGGVFGPAGAGYAHHLGLADHVDILMGTLSKAYGSLGAYVATNRTIRNVLVNRARALIFTTALPPASLAHAFLNMLRAAQLDQARQHLQQRAQHIRKLWQAVGLDLAGSESQVIPVVLGDDKKTVTQAQQLQELGILAVAIRPPTVEQGRARIRFTLTTAQNDETQEYLSNTVLKLCAKS